MITRKAGLFGNLVETQRMVVAVIDKITCTTKPLKRFEIRQIAGVNSSPSGELVAYGLGGKGFCNAAAMNSVNPASLPSCRNL
jgi:hypothetical protein